MKDESIQRKDAKAGSRTRETHRHTETKFNAQHKTTKTVKKEEGREKESNDRKQKEGETIKYLFNCLLRVLAYSKNLLF